jgi:hypothetical protein
LKKLEMIMYTLKKKKKGAGNDIADPYQLPAATSKSQQRYECYHSPVLSAGDA